MDTENPRPHPFNPLHPGRFAKNAGAFYLSTHRRLMTGALEAGWRARHWIAVLLAPMFVLIGAGTSVTEGPLSAVVGLLGIVAAPVAAFVLFRQARRPQPLELRTLEGGCRAAVYASAGSAFLSTLSFSLMPLSAVCAATAVALFAVRFGPHLRSVAGRLFTQPVTRVPGTELERHPGAQAPEAPTHRAQD